MTIDTSRIDRMELRQQLIALDEARKPLADAVDKIDAVKWAKIDAEIAREHEIYERERREREAAYYKRCAEIRAAYGETEGDPEADLEKHDQHEAYELALEYDAQSVVRCCLTGLPLLEGDVLIDDSEGNRALAAAVPGWPLCIAPSDSPSSSRPEGADETDNDDEAA